LHFKTKRRKREKLFWLGNTGLGPSLHGVNIDGCGVEIGTGQARGDEIEIEV